jgi:hypothetical protein
MIMNLVQREQNNNVRHDSYLIIFEFLLHCFNSHRESAVITRLEGLKTC